MLPDSIRALIREEQARQQHRFIEGVDLDAYLAKLDAHAEILIDEQDGGIRGFVAFYCNDTASKQAYITLILVDPRARGAGVGRILVERVLEVARGRGFTSCRLEVATANVGAMAFYQELGFVPVATRGARQLLEVQL